jgi:hypothetical protein
MGFHPRDLVTCIAIKDPWVAKFVEAKPRHLKYSKMLNRRVSAVGFEYIFLLTSILVLSHLQQ